MAVFGIFQRLILILMAASLSACISEADRAERRDAALYIYGPYQYAQNIERIRRENAALGIGVNEPAHIRTLSDHTSRRVTAPNADTLYTSTVLDLSGGPVELILPDARDRYVSVMVMDVFTDVVDLVGDDVANQVRDLAIAIYDRAAAYALERGIVIADTKFEFGLPLDADGAAPILIDEALTPDSSRFWPADSYAPGRDQDSYDKQYVRNYLETLVAAGSWAKRAPGPALPDDVLINTAEKYHEAFELLTGHALDYEPKA